MRKCPCKLACVRLRTAIAGFVALVAAAGLAIGARQSGDVVRLDTFSDISALMPSGYSGIPSSVVFDDSLVQDYNITVGEADWQWLNDNPIREEYVPGSLNYRGRDYDDVGIRYKGFYGSLRFCFRLTGERVCRKLPIKLKFNEYDSAGSF